MPDRHAAQGSSTSIGPASSSCCESTRTSSAESSLRDTIDRALRDHPGDSVVPRLCQLAQLLIDADDKLARLSITLPCNLDTVGTFDGVAVYIGLMPDPTITPSGPRQRADPRALLHHQLEPAVIAGLRDRALDLDHVLARLPGAFSAAEGIVPALSALLGA